MTLSTVLLFLFILAVIYGALSDVTRFKIPNLVSYGLVALFIPYAALNWETLPVLWHLALGFGTLIACIILWQMGWFGGGDAKFIPAIALWLGPAHVLIFGLVMGITGIALVLAIKFLSQWKLMIEAGPWPQFIKQLLDKAEQRAIPYGLPAALGAIAGVLQRMS